MFAHIHRHVSHLCTYTCLHINTYIPLCTYLNICMQGDTKSQYMHIYIYIDYLYIGKHHYMNTDTYPRIHMCLVAQSYLTLCDHMECSPPGSSVHGDSPGKNPGVGCQALLQGIFPTQGLNPGLLYCRQILYCLSHQRSPIYTHSYTHTHTHTHTHMETYVLVHSDIFPHVHKSITPSMYVHVCLHTDFYSRLLHALYIYTYISPYPHTYTSIYHHKFTYLCPYIHTHVTFYSCRRRYHLDSCGHFILVNIL